MFALKNRKRIIAACVIAAVGLGGGIGLAISYKDDRSAVPTANPIKQLEATGAYLQTTLSLKTEGGAVIPYQNGIPVPTFEPQDRTVLSLNGEWMKKRFEADHDFSMAPRSEAWLAELMEKESELAGGSTSAEAGWDTHLVPLPENKLTGLAAANAAETYQDGVWYARTFPIDKLEGGKVYTLKALGISYVADIWINGTWIGFHEGGFTPFAFDVTPYLQEGDNEIRVRIDNPPWGTRDETIPAVAGTDFFNYTGIVQDIYLEKTGDAYVSRVDIVPGDQGKLSVKAVVVNRGSEPFVGSLKGTLFEADRESELYLSSPLASKIKGAEAAVDDPMRFLVDLKPGEVRVVVAEVTVRNAKLWAIGDPNLYVGEFELKDDRAAEGSVVVDKLDTQFGIRTVKTNKTHIMVNDKPVFLAGIARHEEWPDSGRTASWEKIGQDFQQIASQHANMVRTGHYPNHVYTYLMLDRLGLAAMSEIPLWQFETAHYKAQEERRLSDQMWREMVFSQYNRPSVLLWSTQNESKDVTLRLAYNKRLVEDLRTRYDDGRLITQSAAADQPGPEDKSMEPLDVAGWTMYFGIFHGGSPYEGTRQFLEKAHRAYPDKPILNTEFGHWTGDADAESDAQLHIYETTMQAMMEKSTRTFDGKNVQQGYVAGIDFWIMYDWYVNHNQWIDTFGMFHMDRVTAKPIVGRLTGDYGRLVSGSSSEGASTAPRAIIGSGGDREQASHDMVSGDDSSDWSGYAWLRIDVSDADSKAGFNVTLEDESGERWTYSTYEILPNTRYPVYVPLTSAEGIDLSRVKSATVARDEANGFKLLDAALTDDATESWQPVRE